MNKELIEQWAKEAGCHSSAETLEAFARLVAEWQREECAEVCDATDNHQVPVTNGYGKAKWQSICAAAIRDCEGE